MRKVEMTELRAVAAGDTNFEVITSLLNKFGWLKDSGNKNIIGIQFNGAILNFKLDLQAKAFEFKIFGFEFSPISFAAN